MPQWKFSVQHKLHPDEAVRRIRTGIDKIKPMLSDFKGEIHEEWQGRTANIRFRVLAFSGTAKIIVRENVVDIEIEVPFAAMLFKNKIEKNIQENITKFLNE